MAIEIIHQHDPRGLEKINNNFSSLESSEIIPDGADLNDYHDIGLYYANDFTKVLNTPTGLNAFSLSIEKLKPDLTVQTLKTVAYKNGVFIPIIYKRTQGYSNQVLLWGVWVKEMSANIPDKQDLILTTPFEAVNTADFFVAENGLVVLDFLIVNKSDTAIPASIKNIAKMPSNLVPPRVVNSVGMQRTQHQPTILWIDHAGAINMQLTTPLLSGHQLVGTLNYYIRG